MNFLDILSMMEENTINEKTLEELEEMETFLNRNFNIDANCYSFDINYFDDAIELKTKNDSIFLNIDDTKFYSIVAGDEIIYKNESLLEVIQEYLDLDLEEDIYICKEESYEVLYM